MSVRTPPSWLAAGSHPAEHDRLAIAGLMGVPVASTFSGGPSAVDSGHGVVGADDLKVTANGTPNMSVNVAAGACFIRNTQAEYGGVYHLVNDASVNIALASPDATNARIDLIIAQVRDSSYSGASNDARIIAVTGTPAASPSVPSLSAYPNALVLAQIQVNASPDNSIVTGDITDKRTRATALGGTAVCTSTTRPTVPSAGMRIFETDTVREMVYDGSTWVTFAELGNWRTLTNSQVNFATTSSVSSTFRWRRVMGSTIEWECRWNITGGSTGTMQLLLPVAPADTGNGAYHVVGTATWLDAGTGRQVFDVILNSDIGGGLTCHFNYSRGTYMNVVTNTAPAAVAIGDSYFASGRYRAAVG